MSTIYKIVYIVWHFVLNSFTFCSLKTNFDVKYSNKDENNAAYKGLFINDAILFRGGLDCPPPPFVDKNHFFTDPPPPLSSKITCWLTHPPPFVIQNNFFANSFLP